MAEELQKQLGANIEAVEAVEPYSGNFQQTIVPFCTFGSGGLNTSSDALRQALPKAKIVKGYGVRTAKPEFTEVVR